MQWDTWDMSGMSLVIPGLWDGKDSGFTLCSETLGMSLVNRRAGTFRDVPGLWHGKDIGIQVMCSGTLGTCLECH